MTTAVAAATDSPKNRARLDWFVGLGLTHGGEKLADVELEYDGDTIDEDLRGGDLITLAAGIVVYLPLPALSVQSSIGYHFDEISSDDGDIRFDRYPLELIPFYNFRKHRIGAGISYHLSPKLDLKELGGPKVKFDNALGWLVEYDYKFSGWKQSGFVVGMRYMWIDYEVDKVDGTRVSGADIDGNHFGVHMDFMF
ncbi:MAG: hypothetical protein PVG38_07790 [Gammaproteobacteria bacterium]|jgi:hypothetical protein